MTREQLHTAGLNTLKVIEEYRGSQVRRNERAVDPILLGYLRGRGHSVSRQYNVWMYGSNRPHRIDFRVAGNPRSVIELAVRPPGGRYELDAISNHAELKKLSRVMQGEAHMRYLLLLDMSSRLGPIDRGTLEADYGDLNAGRGRFTRNPVRVIYIHVDDQYDFSWNR